MPEVAEREVPEEGGSVCELTRDQTVESLGALRALLGQRTELRALDVVRQRVWKRGVEARIAQAMATLPEAAGPLNSQGLVVKALVVLDERAPEYLEHLASYLDTLLWLEEQS
ncbi:DUF2894 domain-containing protein [Congregibacter litoralis]|uniref:DUF2894 domain-containing protein n=1 Tax=Congregibacter litoralis KT71 TaxID=314285 RepID=A4AAW9_9GAMM|nr:DUF2894 domain-containing protein [Congregibacter litoralis]EAQ96841.1 hypothetical protein KT71_11089 [Congregibacter litoralis KT71]